MTDRVRLLAVAAALPERSRTSHEVEALLCARNPALRLKPGALAAMTGIESRRVAADDVQCSDLAADAARRAMASAGVQASDIDLLIFAAAGQDLIEPATAHIVQSKLGTRCQVLDVKNACMSFVNGLQVAEALILSGAARTALVTTGEISSRAIDWKTDGRVALKQNLAAYTMGDAGAAAVLTRSGNGAGIFYRRFAARSDYWRLATVACGGSMHPRGDEHTYLRGDGPALKDAFVNEGAPIFSEMVREAGVPLAAFARIFVHQVSAPYHLDMLAASGIPACRVVSTVREYGNMASASLPVAFALAVERGEIAEGDRVMWVGMASGISVGVLMMEV